MTKKHMQLKIKDIQLTLVLNFPVAILAKYIDFSIINQVMYDINIISISYLF
jgi:hypothetical protein